MSTTKLRYRPGVPRPIREGGAPEPLARLQAVQEKLARNEADWAADRAALLAERAEAIAQALREGWTLRSLGIELGGVSRQRVQQMLRKGTVK